MNNNPSEPLPFLVSELRDEAFLVRSGIAATIANLRAAENLCKTEHRAGRQTRARLEARQQVHRNLVQHLAQQAHKHAHLCYNFANIDLAFGNLQFYIDPVCRKAIIGCAAAIVALGVVDSNDACPTESGGVVNLAISNLVHTWYTPAFDFDQALFHQWVWIRVMQLVHDIPDSPGNQT